jgi:hypothetical protein
MGAQAAQPWPQRLAEITGLPVINLSQAASGLETKANYLRQFGLPRQPRWVVIEVLPSMDLMGYGPQGTLLAPQLPPPLIQTLGRRWLAADPSPDRPEPIYPLRLELNSGTADVVFFSYYLSTLTVDALSLAASQQWQHYQAGVLALKAEAEASGACALLLYAPTKEETYLSAAADLQQLTPVLSAGWESWGLAADGWLRAGAGTPAKVETLAENAPAARHLLRAFAAEHGLTFVDPSDAMQAAAARGDSPFMRYDSHWSAAGHALVAQQVAAALSAAACP